MAVLLSGIKYYTHTLILIGLHPHHTKDNQATALQGDLILLKACLCLVLNIEIRLLRDDFSKFFCFAYFFEYFVSWSVG